MLSSTFHGRSASSPAAWLAVSFLAGVIGVLVFHQAALAVLHAAGITPGVAYSAKPTSPFGIPQVVSLAFWGGLWGIVAALLFRPLTGARLVGALVIFGAIAPTLVAWFVVAPLKGQPVAGGFKAAAMMTGLIVNGAWGLGTGLVMAWFRGAPRLGNGGTRQFR
jgi:hypothetical protein